MNALDDSTRLMPFTPDVDHPGGDSRRQVLGAMTDTIRYRLEAIAAVAQTAAEALGGAALDFLPAELERFAVQLESVEARLADITDRLAVGVDPQRAGPSACRRDER
jgi:hypothetical protein